MTLVRRTPLISIIGASFRGIMEGARLLMVDFGFSGVIEKIEKYFGQFVAKALLLIIILVIAVVGLSTIYNVGVVPFLLAVQGVIEAQSLSSYWDLIKTFTILILAIALSVSLVGNWKFRKVEQENQRMIDQITASLDEVLNVLPTKAELESATTQKKANDLS